MRPAFKVSKSESHQTCVLIINARVTLIKQNTNLIDPCSIHQRESRVHKSKRESHEIHIDCSTSEKLRGQSPFEFNNGEAISYLRWSFLRRRTTHRCRHSAAFDKEAMCFPFGDMESVLNLKMILKKKS